MLDVTDEKVTTGEESLYFALGLYALALGGTAGLDLGFFDEPVHDLLSAVDEGPRLVLGIDGDTHSLGLGLVHRGVGRALGQ